LTVLSSAFFVSGEAPGFAGEADGDATGLEIGLAGATGAGVATTFGLVTEPLFAAPEQAPNTATLAAKTVDKTIDLLIVFLLNNRNTRDT